MSGKTWGHITRRSTREEPEAEERGLVSAVGWSAELRLKVERPLQRAQQRERAGQAQKGAELENKARIACRKKLES